MQPVKTRHLILLFLGAMATAIAIFGFNFFAIGYSLSDLSTFFLAKDSRIQERLILQPGTSTGVSIVAGTQTNIWVSNPDDLTLPRIELDGTTGVWRYKNRNTGTTTQSFISTNHTHNGDDSDRVVNFEYNFYEIGTSGTYIRYFGTATGRIAGTSTALPQEVYDYNSGLPKLGYKNLQTFYLDTGSITAYDSGNAGLSVQGSSNKTLLLGYDDTIDAGFIGALDPGVTWKNLIMGINGNVGIGTSTPTHKLDVHAASGIIAAFGQPNDALVIDAYGSLSDLASEFYVNDDLLITGYARFGTNPAGTGILRIPNNSDIRARNATNNGDISLIYADTSNNVRINDSGNILLSTNSGNVGIGTTTPSAQLHTTGTVRFSNFTEGTAKFDASGNLSSDTNFKLNINSPAANQFLKYNGTSGKWENSTSSATIAWGGITGNPNDQTDTLMSQAEAEAGTNTASKMPSALRLKQAIGQLPGTTTPQVAGMCLGTTTAGNGSIIEGSRIEAWGYTETEPYTYLSLHANNPGSSTFTDSSNYNTVITAGGNTIGTITAKNGSGSAWFDGTGDYLSCADNDRWQWGTNTTVAAWVNMKTSGYAGSDRTALIAQVEDADNFWALTIWNNLAGANKGKPFFEFKQGGSGYASGYGSIAISENTWTHLAWVKSNNQYQIFVNGVCCATSTSATAPYNLAGALKIGAGTFVTIGLDLNGMVDDLVIASRPLWTTNFIPPPRTIDTINLADIEGDGSSGVSVVIGTRTVQTERTFEVMSGLTTLADSWDTRCDTKLKEVISEDSTLSEQVYNKLKLTEIKKWKFRNGNSEFIGIMIDDPNIPEEIIWRKEGGEIGGFSGTGFINFLYTATKRLIERVEQQQVEIDALKVIVNSK